MGRQFPFYTLRKWHKNSSENNFIKKNSVLRSQNSGWMIVRVGDQLWEKTLPLVIKTKFECYLKVKAAFPHR